MTFLIVIFVLFPLHFFLYFPSSYVHLDKI